MSHFFKRFLVSPEKLTDMGREKPSIFNHNLATVGTTIARHHRRNRVRPSVQRDDTLSGRIVRLPRLTTREVIADSAGVESRNAVARGFHGR